MMRAVVWPMGAQIPLSPFSKGGTCFVQRGESHPPLQKGGWGDFPLQNHLTPVAPRQVWLSP